MLDKTKWTEGEGLLDLSKPSLQALSHILRHKELWPEDFKWDFDDCFHCAMGMAHRLWSESITGPYSRSMEPLGVNRNEAYSLFVFPENKIPSGDIKPEYIASLIDKHLESR